MNRLVAPIKIRKFLRGFTLVEMMIAIGIVGILATIAAPSFTGIFRTFRVRAATDTLMGSILTARIEAMRRGSYVVIMRNSTTGCSVTLSSTSYWDCGWQIFADTNNNGILDGTEKVVQTVSEPKGAGITHGAGAASQKLTVTPWGQPGNVGERFVIYPLDKGVGDPSVNVLCVNAGGRVRKLSGTPVCPSN